jgi:holo-[acyl-carrier protein] synthase
VRVNSHICDERHTTRPSVRIGVDVVDVRAIEHSLATFGERFVSRLFSAHEIAVAKGSAQRLATRFATKEAVIKALDLVDVGVDWRNIEVRNGPSGRPAVQLQGSLAERAKGLGAPALDLSLSHEGDIAIAVVIAQFARPKSIDSG